MHLTGSCQCGAVRFSLRSAHPVPYQRCYCSICRKTGGGGGYAINIAGNAHTLDVTGKSHVAIHHARMRDPGEADHVSSAERTYCRLCGTALWLFSPEWPDLIHPMASAIDTPLPSPPSVTHLMLAFKPDWVRADIRPGDLTFDHYPEESIADWHVRHGLEQPE
jgi:hypothetical protein